MTKSYSRLISLPTFEERFIYLQTNSRIGDETFGFDRYLNQHFYTSKEWRDMRNRIIVRDEGLDLACEGYPIFGPIYIHHISPITAKDIQETTEFLLNPENLICMSFNTHNLLHYGVEAPNKKPIERTQNDTCPWRKL